MLKIFYHRTLGGWQKPTILPFENISLHPASKVLHYAIEVHIMKNASTCRLSILFISQLFEGMKAYRGVDGKIRVFRPDLNMERMNVSAMRSNLPTFDGRELLKCINRLVTIDQEWVPHSTSASLYIRPTLIGIDVSYPLRTLKLLSHSWEIICVCAPGYVVIFSKRVSAVATCFDYMLSYSIRFMFLVFVSSRISHLIVAAQ